MPEEDDDIEVESFEEDEEEEFREPDFVEIGGSPVPGLTLRHVLRGHTDTINRIAWSPDGKYLASPSSDKTIRIWDVSAGECVRVLEGHSDEVYGVAWSPTGQMLASASGSNTTPDMKIRVWTFSTSKDNNQAKYILDGHSGHDNWISWSPNGRFLLSGSFSSDTIKLWDCKEFRLLQSIKVEAGNSDVAWSPNSKKFATGNSKGNVTIWNIENGQQERVLSGNGYIFSICWTNANIFATGGNNIYVWDTTNYRQINILEEHTDFIVSISYSKNAHLLASKSDDNSVAIWNHATWHMVAKIQENSKGGPFSLRTLAFHPHLPILATLGEKDRIIRIWKLDEAILLGQAKENVNYTTAKLVLVGDSGVGKTGLGWRLAHGEFKEHASTHGQQFWSIPQLNLKRKDGTDCEAVLWDLAGQHVYRQVHSIFLDNVSAALVLFDPTNRQDPLKGAQFWLEQLRGKGQLPPTVLVGARVDRGAPALSQSELDQFCQRYGITGGYLSTSAMKGEGLDELMELLKMQIPWDDMTATVTTVTFKKIKDYVLSLKEKTNRKGVLVSPADLRKQLEKSNKPSKKKGKISEIWEFTDAEMMTAVGHLDTHGYVSVLHNSSGEQYILLTPDLLVNLAASIMLLADKNPKELGSISETDILQGKIAFEELKGLSKLEQQILLDAAIQRFLEHHICFRDTLGEDTLLIFPSLIKQKRPLQQDETPSTDDISYVVRGRVENLYASLVVLLGYTPSFSRVDQWQNQAQYEMKPDELCGFRMIEDQEGEIELVLYYGDHMPQKGREKFQELFEQFLYQRDVEVTRFPPAICPKGHSLERNTFISRMREGQKFVFCYQCDDKVALPVMRETPNIGIGASPWLQREEAMARLRSSYEKHLTNIKSYRRSWAPPRAYISHLSEQSQLKKQLTHDLQDAGIYIIDKTENLEKDDFIIVMDTSAYQKAFRAPTTTLSMQLVRAKLGSKKLLSLACEGTLTEHNLKQCTPGNFCDETHYSVSLFNLLLELYAIPLNHKGFEPLRNSLHEQWEQSLAGKGVKEMTSALKVFISYSHKDEEFKDELVTMLAGLQRRGVVDAWQDRRIEAGDEWLKEIEGALDTCDMAVLLVSADFLASRFITEKELPVFIKRREKEGMIVVPIFVRDCLWRSEPFIADLQGLPADGKAVITFSKTNGDRDRIWMKIAEEIERRAKEKSG